MVFATARCAPEVFAQTLHPSGQGPRNYPVGNAGLRKLLPIRGRGL